MTRVAFLGSPPFAVPSFRFLLGSPFRPALLVTPPDRPRGRGRRIAPSELARIADEGGIAVLRSPVPGAPSPAEIETAAGGRPDLLVVVSFGAILRKPLLDLPASGPFNLHASLLPRHRGASPVAAAILAGDPVTGLTVQRMVERLDAGPILLQRETPVGERETAGELSERLAEMGGPVLLEALERLATGRASFREQDESKATVARKLRREEGRIDWRASAVEIDRLVRSRTPSPGAFTEVRGAEVLLLAGTPSEEAPGGTPGTVLAAGNDGVLVGTGRGAYRIESLQRSGGRPMSASEFLRGHPLPSGERLGRAG